MNRDSEAAESLLRWLLQSPHDDSNGPSGADADRNDEFLFVGEAELSSQESWDPLDSEDLSDYLPSSLGFNIPDEGEGSSSLASGENLKVKHHVYALLKRRLRIEIARKPPLFPWEKEIQDYPLDYADYAEVEVVPALFWEAQLREFQWPVSLPTSVMAVLVDRAQSAIQTSMKSGLKLVQVVETLFPDDLPTLNHLAGAVLMSPSRSGLSALSATELPPTYEDAAPVQQMVLSLLAARDLLNTLTFDLSPERPALTRQWHTSVGNINLQLRYDPQQLAVEVELPAGGQIRLVNSANAVCDRSSDLNSDADSAADVLSTHRDDAGTLNLVLTAPQNPSLHYFDLSLSSSDASTIRFAIQIGPDEA